jgi:hypothetical protein
MEGEDDAAEEESDAKRYFIYKHVLSGPRAKARPVNIFYNRS